MIETRKLAAIMAIDVVGNARLMVSLRSSPRRRSAARRSNARRSIQPFALFGALGLGGHAAQRERGDDGVEGLDGDRDAD